jgi:hypothetical protein
VFRTSRPNHKTRLPRTTADLSEDVIPGEQVGGQSPSPKLDGYKPKLRKATKNRAINNPYNIDIPEAQTMRVLLQETQINITTPRPDLILLDRT